MNPAADRLLELGLSQKEASVYLALLELGPSPVQLIAEKAEVQRTTAYVLLESLMKRGLASSVDREKRILFTAESPSKLIEMMERTLKEAEERRTKLADAMPYFFGLFNAMEDKPKVRFFEGVDGIAAARAEIADLDQEFLSFTSIDEATQTFSEIDPIERQRLARRMRGKALIAMKPGFSFPPTELKTWEVREIPFDRAPFTGELDIVGSKVAAFVLKAKPIGFLVESAELAQVFRTLFLAAWVSATPVKK